MDKAVQNSKNISAIVLVIPYLWFHERSASARIIDLMNEMYSMYPDLKNPTSNTFNRFFLALSKPT